MQKAAFEDQHQMQKDELEILEAILGDEICHERDDEGLLLLRIGVQCKALVKSEAVVLEVTLPPAYPLSLPEVAIIEDGQIGLKASEMLTELLLENAAQKLGNQIIYDLFLLTHEFIVGLIKTRAEAKLSSFLERTQKEGKETLELLGEMKNADEPASGKNFATKVAEAFQAEMNCHFPVASDYISLTDVFNLLPKNLLVVKVENIMRDDIAYKFRAFKEELEKRTQKDVEPAIMFHGTHTNVAASIVRTGILRAGERGVRRIHGAAYGEGIYMGKNAEISLNYCNGDSSGSRLFVCATLKGTTRKELVFDGIDFVVLGSSKQILPLFMVHFRDDCSHVQTDESVIVASKAGTFLSVSPHQIFEHVEGCGGSFNNRLEGRMQDDCESAREAAIARGENMFPKHWKILDVADVDEDDDETAFIRSNFKAKVVILDDESGIEAVGEFGEPFARSYQHDRIVRDWDHENVMPNANLNPM